MKNKTVKVCNYNLFSNWVFEICHELSLVKVNQWANKLLLSETFLQRTLSFIRLNNKQ